MTMLVPKFCYAEGEELITPVEEEVIVQEEEKKPIITEEQVNKVVDEATNTVESVALKIAEVVSMISLPIGLLLILWGAVLYFIMGVRNLYKKRQGMLIMWGSATFIVIAKFIHLIVFLVTLK